MKGQALRDFAARQSQSQEAKVKRLKWLKCAAGLLQVGTLLLAPASASAQTVPSPVDVPQEEPRLEPLNGQAPSRNGATSSESRRDSARQSAPADRPPQIGTPPLSDRDLSGSQPAKGLAPFPITPLTILAPEVQPIDLTSALRLAGVQNPELNVARTRILEAAAERQLAAAYFLPSINPGFDYDAHSGVLQQSNGNILSLNRSTLYVGAGSYAVGSGTVNIPGVYFAANIGVGAFSYLASKQTVGQREFETLAVRNQVLLQVTLAYSELLRAEGRVAVETQARDEAREIARLTREYAEQGQGRVADANRAATQLARREAYIKAAEGEVLTASAQLCRVLNLDPSIRLHPIDAFVVPQPIVPDPIPVAELIATGLLNRPELAAQRAAIRSALYMLDGAKVLPFSPNVLVGFSAGGFGGGSNLVRPIFGGFSGREDFDVFAYWTIQNLGVGNAALIKVARARMQNAEFHQVELLNMVRAQVAEAYARAHARYALIGTYEEGVRAGYLSYHEDLIRIRAMGGPEEHNVLPIELLNSFDLLARARLEYLDAIVDYNEAQFGLWVALGQPPANFLAHPVPVEGVIPTGVPQFPAPPGGPTLPSASKANGAPPVVAEANQGQTSAPARQSSTAPTTRTVTIPPPANVAARLAAGAQ
jgi:outer membrane protein TolC